MKAAKTDVLWVASTAVSRASMQVAKTVEHLGALTDKTRAARMVDEMDVTTAALKVGQ